MSQIQNQGISVSFIIYNKILLHSHHSDKTTGLTHAQQRVRAYQEMKWALINAREHFHTYYMRKINLNFKQHGALSQSCLL